MINFIRNILNIKKTYPKELYNANFCINTSASTQIISPSNFKILKKHKVINKKGVLNFKRCNKIKFD